MRGTQPGYPRPQLQRSDWISLDGPWDFSIDRLAEHTAPEQVVWNRTITVPFAPETAASGIGDTSFFCAVWYRRQFERPQMQPRQRLMLHFGAVDYTAKVWVNGIEVYRHQGGYTPFSVDITSALREQPTQEIIVCAEDDPADLEKPRGKQDWKLEPHSIWYPRTTGIWQTVWMEVVPEIHLRSVRWTCNMERWEIGLEVHAENNLPLGARLAVCMRAGDQMLVDDTYGFLSGSHSAGSLTACELHRRIELSDPGIDDFRNDLLWSPDKPTILDVELKLLDGEGVILDEVTSYTALRSVAVQGDRFLLNGRPWPLRLVLDQGYWEDSGQTAPNEDAFLRDILLVKAMGFNGVRKHQKIEDPRFLYWADHLGLLVWEEMPSAYRYTQRSVERLTREWIEILKRDWSHPCIVTWVPFNESWGVPDLPDSAAQRNYVQALYHLTKTLDPSRPVIGNDGWESVATDLIGIHDYDDQPARIAKRYGIDEVEARLFEFERPGGRMLRLGEHGKSRLPIVLTEFGGIALKEGTEEKSWGYSVCHTPEEFLARYTALLDAVRPLPTLAGFCYTQFTDTFQEANGLVYADRTPKFPVDLAARATSGFTLKEDAASVLIWRKRLMELQQ
ncbi:MAG: glycoside hydrolase family 2 [Acidobacteriota bacterium]|nr:glycoside hydrolase family 2 [Acidobacteriota bacterium]